jgi:hypothetical protein
MRGKNEQRSVKLLNTVKRESDTGDPFPMLAVAHAVPGSTSPKVYHDLN